MPELQPLTWPLMPSEILFSESQYPAHNPHISAEKAIQFMKQAYALSVVCQDVHELRANRSGVEPVLIRKIHGELRAEGEPCGIAANHHAGKLAV